MNSFFQLTLIGIPADQEDIISSFCFDWNASGVAQDLAFSQTQFEYQPEIVPTGTINLNVYFETFPGEGFVEELQAQFPGLSYRLTQEQNKDWLAEWKKSFQPFCLAGDFWIVPSWCPTPPEAKRPIFIDPGMAFGTGTHATTQTAARLLIDVSLRQPLKSMIDVGTGTGVLAILAHALGAAPVVATDIDPQAREVAHENLAKNQINQVQVLEEQINEVQDTFDVVVANIVDGVLVKLKPDLLRILKPGGILILSGILKEREDQFRGEFLTGETLALEARLEQDEWVSLQLRASQT